MMLLNTGLNGPPCGTPSVVSSFLCLTITPAFKYLWMSETTRPSFIVSDNTCMSLLWLTVSKATVRSFPSYQRLPLLCFRLLAYRLCASCRDLGCVQANHLCLIALPQDYHLLSPCKSALRHCSRIPSYPSGSSQCFLLFSAFLLASGNNMNTCLVKVLPFTDC